MRIFVCDQCGAKTDMLDEQKYIDVEKKIRDQAVFPYKSGWIYVYNTDIKFSPFLSINLKDKHFDSVSCLKKYFAASIKEAESRAVTEKL